MIYMNDNKPESLLHEIERLKTIINQQNQEIERLKLEIASLTRWEHIQ